MKMASLTTRPVLFVYGTLKRGFPNAHEMPAGLEYLGTGITVNRYPLVVGSDMNIPFVLDLPEHNGASRVRGELYRTSSETQIEALEIFEGVPNQFYDRIALKVELETTDCDNRDRNLDAGSQLDAFCYVRSEVGGGPVWARDWPISRLVLAEMVPEYTLDMAKSFVPRSKRT